MLIGLVAALLAALCFGAASVVQAAAVRRGALSWLVAGAAAGWFVGWLLHVVAITRLPLYLAQLAVAVSLAVTAVIAARMMHEPLERRHWLAIGGMLLGVGLLVAAAGGVGEEDFTGASTVALYTALLLSALVGWWLLRRPGRWTGASLGLLGGADFAGSAIATRSLVEPAWDWTTVVPALTIVLFGLLGFGFYSAALQRSTVTSATAPLVLVETLVPAFVGVVAMGDRVRAGWWPLAVTGFALCVACVLELTQAEERLGQFAHDDQGSPRTRAPATR